MDSDFVLYVILNLGLRVNSHELLIKESLILEKTALTPTL